MKAFVFAMPCPFFCTQMLKNRVSVEVSLAYKVMTLSLIPRSYENENRFTWIHYKVAEKYLGNLVHL